MHVWSCCINRPNGMCAHMQSLNQGATRQTLNIIHRIVSAHSIVLTWWTRLCERAEDSKVIVAEFKRNRSVCKTLSVFQHSLLVRCLRELPTCRVVKGRVTGGTQHQCANHRQQEGWDWCPRTGDYRPAAALRWAGTGNPAEDHWHCSFG